MMLRLRIPAELESRLVHELRCAGIREIGGVLVGEQIAPGDFRLLDFSVQRSGGGIDCFIRDPKRHNKFLTNFFSDTGHDYGRFNYLGEWHSHPSFLCQPSSKDLSSMQEIVDDEINNSPIAMLIITRIDPLNNQLEINATGYKRMTSVQAVEVIRDSAPHAYVHNFCSPFDLASRWIRFWSKK